MTPSGHCFGADWTCVQCDGDTDDTATTTAAVADDTFQTTSSASEDASSKFPKMSQFYSENFAGDGNANAKTTMIVKPKTRGDGCCTLVVILTVLPHHFVLILGKLMFCYAFKKQAKNGILQDLHDLKTYCEKLSNTNECHDNEGKQESIIVNQ